MLAFTNTTMTKKELLTELKIHEKHDDFVKGSYGSEGMKKFKGCAVGCSLESLSRKKGVKFSGEFSEHRAYEPHFGVPEWLARVEDRIFEGLPPDEAKKWPVKFTSSINPGADLNTILKPYLIIICEAVIPFVDVKTHAPIIAGIKVVIALLKNKKATRTQFLEARKSLYGLRRNAAADAAYAAYAADAAAADAAAYAADAAYAAAYAAYDDAAAYAAADAAARFKMHGFIAKKLLVLIKNCKAKRAIK